MKFRLHTVSMFIAAFCVSGCGKPSQSISKNVQDSQLETSAAVETIDLENAIGKKAPEIKLEAAFNGVPAAEMTLAQLKGRVVVLDYWATW